MANDVGIRHRTRPQSAPVPDRAADTRQPPAPAPDSDAVGYGKPPTYTRFKPGRSGNPRGRPKGRKNFQTELLEELHEGITVREGGRRRMVSKQRAMLKTLTAKALQGDARAATLIVNTVFRILQQDEEPVDDRDLSAEDRAILKDYENRISQKTPAPPSPQPSKGDTQ